MSDTIIQAEGLGKKYTLSHQRQSYYALRDVMANSAKRWGRKLIHPIAARRDPDPTHEEFWALKDVSFEIKEGDRVGIIGRNGAGKSTLLKILSRITEPTNGQVSIHGRVASLLEVGTGFHPELTGRENVYLNGAILGMTKAEIKKKFDEIVAFAEVEKFLDTPVKRYSSGMYVRLAFAVAAHLEPEILIVDEVLAVGDAQFQKKCLGKMEDVAKGGRTVLFVSHNMGAVAQLCNKAILLHKGVVEEKGSVQEVVTRYLNQFVEKASFEADSSLNSKEIGILRIQSCDHDGKPTVVFAHNQPIILNIACKAKKYINGVELGVRFRDSKRNIFTTETRLTYSKEDELINAKVTIPGNLLIPQDYFITFGLYLRGVQTYELLEDALAVKIIDSGSKYALYDAGNDFGCIFVDCEWQVNS